MNEAQLTAYIAQLEKRIADLENRSALGGAFSQSAASTNTVLDVLRAERRSTGTAADGIGLSFPFMLQDASGNVDEAANIDVVLTTAAHATEEAAFYVGVLGTNYFRVTSGGAIERWTGAAWVPFGTGVIEDNSALCNGAKVQFDTTLVFGAGTTRVFLNGILQRPGAGNDYTEDVDLNGITFGTAPLATDHLIIAYGGGWGSLDPVVPADLYIATTGNDTTGNGTSAAPYLTLAKALSTLPAHIYTNCTIHVADGTYAEGIDLRRFRIQPPILLKITGNTTTPANVTFTGVISQYDPFWVASYDCGCAVSGQVAAEIEGIRINVTGGFGVHVSQQAKLTIDRCTILGTISIDAICATTFGYIEIQGATTLSGFAAAGIRALAQSEISFTGAGTITITGAGVGSAGISAGYKSLIVVLAADVDIVITEVQYGFVVTLGCVFQHYGTGGSLSADNLATPAGSAGILGTDVSSWSTSMPLTLDHFTNEVVLNSISYAEAAGGHTVTNCGAADVTQNSVQYFP